LKDTSGTGSVAAESVAKFGISMTVCGKRGVTVETAAMVTGFVVRFRANARLDSTSAAPPSLVAQIWSRRSGSETIAEASTSSTL
jgi:hypothetical protein